MPRIENDIKLDFKDVLLRPKRSTLKSRSEVPNLGGGREIAGGPQMFACSEVVGLSRLIFFEKDEPVGIGGKNYPHYKT